MTTITSVSAVDNELVNLTVFLDSNGNLYLSKEGNTDKIFQINVDNKNGIYCDLGNYDVIAGGKQMINQLVFYEDKENLNGNNDDNNDNNDDNDEKPENYFPEDNNYEEIYDDVIDSDEKDGDDDDGKFLFFASDEKIDMQINNRNNGDILALYETLIYDNYKLIFKTTQTKMPIIYRLFLYKTGTCEFRPIGYKSTKYKIIIDKNDDISLQLI